MKIPKAEAMKKSLEGEAAILSHLADAEKRDDIPQLCEPKQKTLSEVRLLRRHEVSTLHCLKLKGIVGCPVSSWVRTHSGLKQEHLKKIIQDVYGALCFAHAQNVFHLDIRPGNIIVLGGNFDNRFSTKVMLSDWGCALKDKDSAKQNHFRGCPPYAHDSLFRDEPWTPNNILDFASLAYTLAHLMEDKLLWRDISSSKGITEKMLEDRRDLVRNHETNWFGGFSDKEIRGVFREATGLHLRRSDRNIGRRT